MAGLISGIKFIIPQSGEPFMVEGNTHTHTHTHTSDKVLKILNFLFIKKVAILLKKTCSLVKI